MIEIVQNDVVIDDGALRAVVFDIGPTDHVAQLLAVYFPRERLLYQADMFDPNSEEHAFAGADAAVLAQRIAERGLDVETIVSAHGAIASPAALRKGLEIRAKYGARDSAAH